MSSDSMVSIPLSISGPATPGLVRVARLATAGILDEETTDRTMVHEAQLAVDELMAIAIELIPDNQSVRLELHNDDSRLHMRVSVSSSELPKIDPIAQKLIDALLSDFSCTQEGESVVLSGTLDIK